MLKLIAAAAWVIAFASPAMAQEQHKSTGHADTTLHRQRPVDHLKHAVSGDSGKPKSTPSATLIPGSSTTGNATGPGGTTSGGSAGPAVGAPADPTRTPPPR